jgi:ABC-type multidrug transport system fused ATPase/permease subunit
MSLPIFASMLAFITYSLTSHALAPAHIFSSLALFNSLRMPLNLLPLVIGQVVDAWSSIYRIQEYLLSEEQDDEGKFDLDAKNAVEMDSADFTWERTATRDPDHVALMAKKQTKADVKIEKNARKQAIADEKLAAKTRTPPGKESSGANTPDDSSTLIEDREPFKLHNMNFSIGRNELVAVIGSVGSGKSSLLAALAGDMRRTKGDLTLGASRAFCPQYAWIQNATVRENILFGKDMDRDW